MNSLLLHHLVDSPQIAGLQSFRSFDVEHVDDTDHAAVLTLHFVQHSPGSVVPIFIPVLNNSKIVLIEVGRHSRYSVS